jgi:hypothetical protein
MYFVMSNFNTRIFEGDEGEAEANPTLLLEDRHDAFLKHNANLPVSIWPRSFLKDRISSAKPS